MEDDAVSNVSAVSGDGVGQGATLVSTFRGGVGVEGDRRRDRGSPDRDGSEADSIHRRTDAGLAGTVEPLRKCPGGSSFRTLVWVYSSMASVTCGPVGGVFGEKLYWGGPGSGDGGLGGRMRAEAG